MKEEGENTVHPEEEKLIRARLSQVLVGAAAQAEAIRATTTQGVLQEAAAKAALGLLQQVLLLNAEVLKAAAPQD